MGLRGSAGGVGVLCLNHSGPASLCFGLHLYKAGVTDSAPMKWWLEVLPSSWLALRHEGFTGCQQGRLSEGSPPVPRGASYFRSVCFAKAASRAPICHCCISIPTEDCGRPKPAIREGCGLSGRPGHWASFPSIAALLQAWDYPWCTPLTLEHCGVKRLGG